MQKIHGKGFRIVLHTARGSRTGKNWIEITKKQLQRNDIPYDELRFEKPGSDFYIDDKNISVKKLKKILGLWLLKLGYFVEIKRIQFLLYERL